TEVPLDDLPNWVLHALEEDQGRLFEEANQFQLAQTRRAASLEEVLEAARTGFARFPLSLLEGDGEDRLNRQGVSIRAISGPEAALPLDLTAQGLEAVAARAY
ncbi:MAG: hypothetical protein ACREN7_04425, partial [Candidatus Dormibacteria bacterium]